MSKIKEPFLKNNKMVQVLKVKFNQNLYQT